MSRKNKKNKKIIGNQSLSERLEQRWNEKKWDAFVLLYMRNKSASELTKQAPRLPDALYNACAQALFVFKDAEAARAIADIILSEENLGDGGAVLRACARLAIDAAEAARGNAPVFSNETARADRLPAPFEELREKMARLFPEGKDGADRKNSPIEKFIKQFQSLPKAKTASPYSTFNDIAARLEREAAGKAHGDAFKALRLIASLLLELVRPGTRNHWRDPSAVSSSPQFKEIPHNQSHPAVFALWSFFCEKGGEKFDLEWESTARAMQLSFARKKFEFEDAYHRLSALPHDVSEEDYPITALRFYSGWTDHERFLLTYFAVHVLSLKYHDFFLSLPRELVIGWFRTLGEIGRRWRPKSPWPEQARRAFELLAVHRASTLTPYMMKADLPCEAMTPPTVIFITMYSKSVFDTMTNRISHLLPFRLSSREAENMNEFLAEAAPKVEFLRHAKLLLDGETFDELLRRWISTVVSECADMAIDEAPLHDMPWNDITSGHLELVSESLPHDDQIGCFCRLCRGMKRFALSGDQAGIEAFFAAKPCEDGSFSAHLFVFLATWPEIDHRFLSRLFKNAIPAHEAIGWWDAIFRAVTGMANEDSRYEVAFAMLTALKKHFVGKNKDEAAFFTNKLKSFVKKRSRVKAKAAQKLLFADDQDGPEPGK
ncbi:MAG: hypothetical protein LBQ36_01565 [Synergistaceae bacterium]|jgi:hypothetical protein|nr:hypothetical protein [Synergistaceae bacterium]